MRISRVFLEVSRGFRIVAAAHSCCVIGNGRLSRELEGNKHVPRKDLIPCHKFGVRRLVDAGLPRDTLLSTLHKVDDISLPSYLRYHRARRIPLTIWWGINSISRFWSQAIVK